MNRGWWSRSPARTEPDQLVSELEPAEQPEPAAAGQAWFDPADKSPEPAAAGQAWFDDGGHAAESPEAASSVEPEEAPDARTLGRRSARPGRARGRCARAQVAAPEPEAVETAPEPEPQATSDEGTPSEPFADEAELEPSATAPAGVLASAEPSRSAEPPWYDPGDEDLEAARSAAAPAFTPPEEPGARLGVRAAPWDLGACSARARSPFRARPRRGLRSRPPRRWRGGRRRLS